MKLALVCAQFGFLVSVGAFNVRPNSHRNVKVATTVTRFAGEEGHSRRTFTEACATFVAGALIYGSPQGASALDSCKYSMPSLQATSSLIHLILHARHSADFV